MGADKTTPVTKKGKKRSSGATSSAGESAPGIGSGMCLFPRCDLDQKKGSRWCSLHDCHYQNLRYAQEHDTVYGSKERRIKWVESMKDPQHAIKELENHAAKNAGVAKWKNSNKQHLVAQWEEQTGHRIRDEKGKQRQPFEQEEWIRKNVNEKGWDRQYCEEQWGEYLAENTKRDYKGRRGEVRLWLVGLEYDADIKEKYMDQAATTKSEEIKNPKAEEMYALHMHVHDQARALNHQHEFFKGGAGAPSGTSFPASKPSENPLEATPSVDGEVPDAADGEHEGVASEPPMKKLKGNIIKIRVGFNDSLEAGSTKVSSIQEIGTDRKSVV